MTPRILKTCALLSAATCWLGCGSESGNDQGGADNDGVESGTTSPPQAFPGRHGEMRTELLALPGLLTQQITYEMIDGLAVFQGDIAFDLERARSLVTEGNVSRGAARANELSRWVGGVVPFLIDGSVNASDPRIDGAGGAISIWQNNTAIRFVRRTSEASYINFVTTATDGCFSTDVGRSTVNPVTIHVQNPGCNTSAVVHEIGHAVGLYHEQSRSDRDSWIAVNWNNIKSDWKSQFNTYVEKGKDGFDSQGFDFNSVMLYSSFQGSQVAINPAIPVMTKRSDGSTWNPGVTLSAGDVQAVGRMYPRFSSFPGDAMVKLHSSFGAGITSWGPGRLDVVAVDDSGNLVHQFSNSGSWSGWVDNWHGVLTSDVDVTSWGPNRLDVVGRGTDSAVWHFTFDGGVVGWEPLGGATNFAPTICSTGPNNLSVFAVGTDNQAYWRRKINGGAWTNWAAIGGVLTTAIDCVGMTNGRIDLASRNSANHVVHKAFVSGSWSDWGDLGGFANGRVTIAQGQLGAHFDLFAQGGDANIWKRSYQIEWEPNWSQVGGAGAEPDVFSWGTGRLDMVVRDPASGNIEHAFVQN